MKKVAILYSEYSPVIDAIINQLENIEVEAFTSLPDNHEEYNLIVAVNYNSKEDVNILKCHHSLLPAFSGNEPVKDAFIAGVKITGITIYFTKPEKIVAQYPLFIPNDAHFDEIEQQLNYLEQVIYPIVIDKLIKDEPIDVSFINRSAGCSGGKCSGGCSGCTH